MEERDYILATNLTKLRIARQLLADLVAGPEYGVPEDLARPVAIAELDAEKLVVDKPSCFGLRPDPLGQLKNGCHNCAHLSNCPKAGG